jgi:hypothetical protein
MRGARVGAMQLPQENFAWNQTSSDFRLCPVIGCFGHFYLAPRVATGR